MLLLYLHFRSTATWPFGWRTLSCWEPKPNSTTRCPLRSICCSSLITTRPFSISPFSKGNSSDIRDSIIGLLVSLFHFCNLAYNFFKKSCLVKSVDSVVKDNIVLISLYPGCLFEIQIYLNLIYILTPILFLNPNLIFSCYRLTPPLSDSYKLAPHCATGWKSHLDFPLRPSCWLRVELVFILYIGFGTLI